MIGITFLIVYDTQSKLITYGQIRIHIRTDLCYEISRLQHIPNIMNIHALWTIQTQWTESQATWQTAGCISVVIGSDVNKDWTHKDKDCLLYTSDAADE